MNFPAYVPTGARDYIRRTLEGGTDGDHWKGINAFVAEYRADGIQDSDDALQGLLKEQACLQRFAHDSRMRDAYTALQVVFTTDAEYAGFLRCAEAASLDFAPWRESIKTANAVKSGIANKARELASLIEQAGKEGHGYAPAEFFSVCTLLAETEADGHNRHIWPSVRGTITGEQRELPPVDQAEAAGDEIPRAVKVVWSDEECDEARQVDQDALLIRVVPMEGGGKVERDPEQKAREMLRYAWEKAPDLPALLETVAQAATHWTPGVGGAIGAAIASRQKNRATEYLRAFDKSLRENGIAYRSAGFRKAMACVANVVLNDPDMDVSADAVRKAIPPPL